MRLTLVIVFASLFFACDATTSAPQTTSQPTTTSPPGVRCEAPYPSGAPSLETVFCADPSVLETAPVVRVVDGDTIRVLMDGVEEPVRFYGIDTTERGDACFKEATDRTRQLVGDEVRLRADARNRDRSKRLLRYVYTDSGVSIDALLVAEGLAYAWREDGAYRSPLIALEDLARGLRRGCLWSGA